MELEIYSPSEDGYVKEIKWNHEQIKTEVAEKVSYYKNLLYTDDQIKIAKSDRAKLNKFVQALEEKRKEIKKRCLEPYEDFESKLKEITEIVNEPIKVIDAQVKAVEEKAKAEKLKAIKAFFLSRNFPDFVEFEQIFNSKWLNVTKKLDSVKEEISAKKKKVLEELSTLSNLPEFAFEATEVYKSTLDINKAILEGQKLAETAKRKANFEAEIARRKAEENLQEAKELAASKESIASDEPVRAWMSFKANLTLEDAKALKTFFAIRKIEFERI